MAHMDRTGRMDRTGHMDPMARMDPTARMGLTAPTVPTAPGRHLMQRQPQAQTDRAIGVMDSGLGGLNVLAEIHRQAQHQNLIYYADTAHCPYGNKSVDFIRKRVHDITTELIEQGVSVMVLACNTASAAALDWLRTQVDIPVVGMEPAIKPAAAATKNGRVGVLATGVTLQADRFASLLERFASGIEVISEPAQEFVDLVEAGRLSGPDVERIVRDKLRPLIEARVDTLVLGCTHYPFLTPLFERLLPPNVTIIDPGPQVAAQALRVHPTQGSLGDETGQGQVTILSSESSHYATEAARRLCPELFASPAFDPSQQDETARKPIETTSKIAEGNEP